jgi:hypothetical protein
VWLGFRRFVEQPVSSPGHAFYDRLPELLSEAGFDAFVEEVYKPHYARRGLAREKDNDADHR